MASSSQFQGQGHDSSTVPTEHAESMVNRGHIDIAPHATDHKPTQSSKVVRDSKGWDGKLRVDKKALKLMQHQGGGGGGGAHNGMENTEEMDAEAKSDSGTDDDDDDDSEESKTEVVRGHDSSVAAVPAEAGLAAGDRRVEIKDGEEIEADEDLLEDLEEDVDEIDLVHCKISSIPSLRLDRFTKVERICLRQNVITKAVFPTSLGSSLQELDLYDNLISKLDGPRPEDTADSNQSKSEEKREGISEDGSDPSNKLGGLDCLKELTSLDLSFNKIKRIRNLGHLNKLRELYFVQNKISKIEGLEEMKDLTCLELGANRIRTIENLDALTSLNELWLGKNKITELQGISTLRNLKILAIQSNRLTSLGCNNDNSIADITNSGDKSDSHFSNDVTNGSQRNANVNADDDHYNNLTLPLSALISLTELYVSHNALTSLAGLSAGPSSLRILDISNNPLSSLAGLEPLTNLEELWASNCRIDDWKEVERAIGTDVSGKHALETVYLEGNPVQKKQQALYRGKVKLLVPGVRQIDASFVRV